MRKAAIDVTVSSQWHMATQGALPAKVGRFAVDVGRSGLTDLINAIVALQPAGRDARITLCKFEKEWD